MPLLHTHSASTSSCSATCYTGLSLSKAAQPQTAINVNAVHAGASAVSQPLQTEGKSVVALSVPGQPQSKHGDGANDGGSVHLVSLQSGERLEQLPLGGLGLSTDSGGHVGCSLVVLGRKAESSEYR